jgi:putative redox protein
LASITVRNLPGHVYAMEVEDGRHTLVMDEDRNNGGEDLGPEPYEMLLAALGGCTAITALMYARRKGWPVEDVTVTLNHDKVHPGKHEDVFSAEEAAAAGPAGRLDLIQMTLFVKGDLDAAQLARLHEIANRCPVHRTLEARPKIVSEVVRVE